MPFPLIEDLFGTTLITGCLNMFWLQFYSKLFQCGAIFSPRLILEARPEGVEALRRNRVPTVILVRDLRDQCVSRFYHVINQPSHRHHEFYLNGERSEAFSHCVGITIDEYSAWIRDWLRLIQTDGSLFLVVRYKDIRVDPKGQFLRVLKHFDIDLSDKIVNDIIESVSVRANRDSDLSKRLKKGKNTLHAGCIGDWRSHFYSSDIDRFKEVDTDQFSIEESVQLVL
jgi:hypothetical protein